MNYNVPALSLNNISSYVSSVIAIPDLSQEEEIRGCSENHYCQPQACCKNGL